MSAPVRIRPLRAFTLVELLVVIFIIALLIALLAPSLTAARSQAKWVQCQSNQRQIGQALLMYANEWRGAMFPPRLGAGSPRDKRWPVHVFHPPKWNPPVMLCPEDIDPAEEHSYILNNHLADHNVKYSSKIYGGIPTSDVVLMGEKNSFWDDYYMNASDFFHHTGDYFTRVERFRHGVKRGSNYLFLDLHVGVFKPRDESDLPPGIDPWDTPTTQPVQ